MEKKTILLELPCELIDKIDSLNSMGDRSAFVTHLLEKQTQQKEETGIDANTELTTKMSETESLVGVSPGMLNLVDNESGSIGKFDLNTVEGFEELAKKIEQISENPIVRIRVRGWI